MDFLAERAVTIRRPAFRAPAASGAQYDVSFNGKTSQELQNEDLLSRRHREDNGRHAGSSTCTVRGLSILIDDVSSGVEDEIGAEGGDTELKNGWKGKYDPARNTNEKRQRGGLPQP